MTASFAGVLILDTLVDDVQVKRVMLDSLEALELVWIEWIPKQLAMWASQQPSFG